MRRISWHTTLIATSTIAILAAQTTVAPVSWGATPAPKASLSAASKAQLNKEIQEYVAKNKAKGAGGEPAASGGEAAAGEALSKLTKSPEEAATATPTTTAAASSTSGSSTGSILLIAGLAALVLLGGIVLYIYRDTRRVAPVTSGSIGTSAATPNAAARQRKRRAKAKAARQQRKRNR
jgi:hypothetical protein